jgi:hypothetical protein
MVIYIWVSIDTTFHRHRYLHVYTHSIYIDLYALSIARMHKYMHIWLYIHIHVLMYRNGKTDNVIRTVLTPCVSTQRHHGSSLHIYFHETFNDQLPIDAFDFVISSCNLTYRWFLRSFLLWDSQDHNNHFNIKRLCCWLNLMCT